MFFIVPVFDQIYIKTLDLNELAFTSSFNILQISAVRKAWFQATSSDQFVIRIFNLQTTISHGYLVWIRIFKRPNQVLFVYFTWRLFCCDFIIILGGLKWAHHQGGDKTMEGEMRATDCISTLTSHVASKLQFQLQVHICEMHMYSMCNCLNLNLNLPCCIQVTVPTSCAYAKCMCILCATDCISTSCSGEEIPFPANNRVLELACHDTSVTIWVSKQQQE